MQLSHLSTAEAAIRERLGHFDVDLRKTLDSRMQGPITPNADLKLCLPKQIKQSELQILGIASWFVKDQVIAWFLRLEIRERDHHSDDFVRLATDSVEGAESLLLSSYSERDFYGNFLRNMERLVKNLRMQYYLQRKSRHKVRRRGYRDHGTLRPLVCWRPTSDFSLTEQQNLIEEKRETHEALYESFWGWAVQGNRATCLQVEEKSVRLQVD